MIPDASGVYKDRTCSKIWLKVGPFQVDTAHRSYCESLSALSCTAAVQ